MSFKVIHLSFKMDSRLILLIITVFFWFIFAIFGELKWHDDSFSKAKFRDRDSIHSSLRKIVMCIDCDSKTIKWRRTLIAATIATILIFSLVHVRLPSPKEFLLYILLIFIVFYISWHSYMVRTTGKAASYAKNHVENIKRCLTKEKSFILPF